MKDNDFYNMSFESNLTDDKWIQEEIMESKNRDVVKNRKHIVIETPCTASDVESFLHIVSHEGHWHDAKVIGLDGKIVIEYSEYDV